MLSFLYDELNLFPRLLTSEQVSELRFAKMGNNLESFKGDELKKFFLSPIKRLSKEPKKTKF